MNKLNVKALINSWATLIDALGGPLRAIRSATDLRVAIEVLDSLLEATAGDLDHPLQGLVALVGELIEAYETKAIGEPDASPADVLRMLMAANSLTQADLANEVGGQSVVSAILNGHRTINARQAGALATRFRVSAAVFIAKPALAPVPAIETRAAAPTQRLVPVQNIVLRRKIKFARRMPLPKDIPTVDARWPNVLHGLSGQQATPREMLTLNFH